MLQNVASETFMANTICGYILKRLDGTLAFRYVGKCNLLWVSRISLNCFYSDWVQLDLGAVTSVSGVVMHGLFVFPRLGTSGPGWGHQCKWCSDARTWRTHSAGHCYIHTLQCGWIKLVPCTG